MALWVLQPGGGQHNPPGHLKPGVYHSSAELQPGSGYLEVIATGLG